MAYVILTGCTVSQSGILLSHQYFLMQLSEQVVGARSWILLQKYD